MHVRTLEYTPPPPADEKTRTYSSFDPPDEKKKVPILVSRAPRVLTQTQRLRPAASSLYLSLSAHLGSGCMDYRFQGR